MIALRIRYRVELLGDVAFCIQDVNRDLMRKLGVLLVERAYIQVCQLDLTNHINDNIDSWWTTDSENNTATFVQKEKPWDPKAGCKSPKYPPLT